MRTLAALLLAFLLTSTARAAEPWLKKDDVVALVGGEDMVALAEEGWLETLVTWAQPQDRIRWRSLAWEGDTVFEQRRDLNYPTLETQLDRMGATVVICQFGKMESFAGKEGVAAFTEAYGKLIERFSGEKKRRIALVLPPRFGPLEKDAAPLLLPDLTHRNADVAAYVDAIRTMATKHDALVLEPDRWRNGTVGPPVTRDGVHYTVSRSGHPAGHGQFWCGIELATGLGAPPNLEEPRHELHPKMLAITPAIAAKNRLWFHYTRPQNWAFLAGNRTNQPSSRDHKDPTKRWFPEEMEQWVPLIEAKEQEIWKLAAAPR